MSHAIHTIGFDVGGTNIKAAAFARDGSLLDRWVRPTHDSPCEGTPRFAEVVREILNDCATETAAVGIAAPGLAAKDGQSIGYVAGKMHGLAGLDWTEFLQRSENVPVLNDGHAALLGEVWRGAARGCENAVMLTLGTGVGGAILTDGKLLKVVIGRAGHLGHVSINEQPERSLFGVPGTLEVAIGNSTIAARTNGRFTSTSQLVEAVRNGDQDPEIVILGGGIAQAGADLFDPLAKELDDLEWRPDGHRVRVVPAQLDEWAGAYGAAYNALNQSKGNQHEILARIK